MKEKFLLHTCCAPCSAYVIEELKDKYDLTLFFYNPNIHPNREYLKRKEELKIYCEKKNIKYIEGKYDITEWFEITKKYKGEPEKGKRCGYCFKMRLNETAEYAKNNNFDVWGTTLSISPHKDAELINKIGLELADKYKINYLEANWKKQGGFQKSCEISREEDFYRQDYCGCVYSMRRLINKDKNKDGN